MRKLLILLLLLLTTAGCGLKVETVEEHDANVESAANERSSALESMLDSEADESYEAAENTTADSEYIMVHITITCSKIIDNSDLSTDAVLSDDGIILDTYAAVKDGDTVFTALETAAGDNGISISYTGSGSSVYISGINELYEKQCGRYSGWKYSVNNEYPNVGCGGYALSDGDSILFGYVANYNDTY